MSIELLVNALARGTLGLISALVFGFIIWRVTWISVDLADLRIGLFFLAYASIVGGAATIPTVFAWWNTESPRRIHLVFIVLTLVVAVASAWLVNEIRGVRTYHALVGGVQRVPVFSISHMFVSMILGAAFGGNTMAAAFYIYRVLRHRET